MWKNSGALRLFYGSGSWTLKPQGPSLCPWLRSPLESISELRHCFSDFIKNATKTHAVQYATSVLSGAFLLAGSIFLNDSICLLVHIYL